jgi:adenylate cyclase
VRHDEADASSGERRTTAYQRHVLKTRARQARKRSGEALTPTDWEAYFEYGAQPTSRLAKRLLRALPSTPRCGFCGAPFAGIGSRLVKPFGFAPSRKNPSICSTCVELAPPGGTTIEAGVMFADLRGFTTLSERIGPERAGGVLRRFYGLAEKVLFPEALITKLVGDQVMALYIPVFAWPTLGRVLDDAERRALADVMLAHAQELLARVGDTTAEGGSVELGVGLDFGEVFIGNIGDGAVQDFTAVGDIVNTASRLQGEAAAGEVVLSARVARLVAEPLGPPEQLLLKGKPETFEAYRLRAVEALD